MEPNLHRAVTIDVRVSGSHYRVLIGKELLKDVGTTVASVARSRRATLISDEGVAAHWKDSVLDSLANADIEAVPMIISAGEPSKSLSQIEKIVDQMTQAGLDRQSFVIGLGGGVIGDISGFVAAIFHRGIPHVQIPTTLLAMVDSSIGGKNGVNTTAGKNLIGAVHHPALVIDDVDLLQTLPSRQFKQGFAEIIKHGIIADADLFATLRPLAAASREDMIRLIERNVAIKARIVERDEHDRLGDRAILNFGHTIGHAIERAGDYREFLHGEAISLGMVAAANVSVRRAGLKADDRDAIVALLKRFDLPTELPRPFPREKILQALKFDKKFEKGAVRFVVCPAIGSARLTSDVTLDDLREAIANL